VFRKEGKPHNTARKEGGPFFSTEYKRLERTRRKKINNIPDIDMIIIFFFVTGSNEREKRNGTTKLTLCAYFFLSSSCFCFLE